MSATEYNFLVVKNSGVALLNTLAVITSLSNVEQWMRIASLGVGIIAGILAIVISIRKLSSAPKREPDEQ